MMMSAFFRCDIGFYGLRYAHGFAFWFYSVELTLVYAMVFVFQHFVTQFRIG